MKHIIISAFISFFPLATSAAPEPTVGTNAAPRMAVAPVLYPTPGQLTVEARKRLQAERAMIAREMKAITRWKSTFGQRVIQDYIKPMDDVELDRLVTALNTGAENTVQDNIRRFAELAAGRIEQFAKAYGLYKAGEYGAAVVEFDKLLAEKVTMIKIPYQHDTLPPFTYCVTRFLVGECRAREGTLKEALIDYQVVFDKLPSSVTFGATARMRAALMYEQTERAHFSIAIYKALAERFIGVLADPEMLRIRVRILKLVNTDPYRLALADAGDVTVRLEREAAGESTRNAQDRLIDELTRMLIEEVSEPRPFLEYTDALVGNEIKEARLREGSIAEKLLFTEDVSVIGSDDWGALRPREKQELLQIFHETYSDRYREMLEHYYRNISEAEK